MNRSRTATALLVTLAIVASASTVRAFPQPGGAFIVKENLGTLPGDTSSRAYAINSSRQITGKSGTTAFVWTPPGPMIEVEPGQDLQWGSDINDAGQITGTSFGMIQFWDGFLWTPPGPAIALVPPPGILFDEWPSAINELGEVVGGWEDPPTRPFFWRAPGPMTDLGTLGGTGGSSSDINESSEVVGTSGLPGDVESHGFYWTEAGGMIDLGDGGASGSGAQAINDLGEIVGNVNYGGGVMHVAYWPSPNDALVDLGTIGGAFGGSVANAFDINNDGIIVGRSTIDPMNDETRAFRLFPGGEMRDLGTLGGDNSEAFGINEAGHIAGFAELPNGDSRATAWWVYPLNDIPACGCGLASPGVNDDDFDIVIPGSSTLDARFVDARTVTFGDSEGDDTPVARDARTGAPLAKLADHNGDGLLDLIVTFDKVALRENGDWSPGTPELWLQGATFDRAKGVYGIVALGATGVAPAAGDAAPSLAIASSPNPFAGSTILRFSLPESAPAKLVVFDASGRNIATLLDGNASRGEQTFVWHRNDASGRRVAPGVYFARLSTLGRESAAKLVVVD
ncbi:MAG: FlgD immunoglobulin-like domain containing protein [bacterium]